jgi:hypothetical protein
VFLEPPAIVDGNLPFALGTYFLGHLNPRSLRNPRYRHVIEAQHRIAEERIKEIWTEQEAWMPPGTDPTDHPCRWPPGMRPGGCGQIATCATDEPISWRAGYSAEAGDRSVLVGARARHRWTHMNAPN